MHRKYVFVDVDGTIIDHSTRTIPESAKTAIKKAQENGHVIVISTGRPPCLFYGIEKEVGVDSYIAANGRYVVHHEEVLLNNIIPKDIVKKMVEYVDENDIDIAFEGLHEFKRRSNHTDLYIKFSENFHIEIPKLDPDFYIDNDVYQITLYQQHADLSVFEAAFPELTFAISCDYGIDVNTKGGLKEQGIAAFIDKYSIKMEDIIAIGDGHNDISMFDYVDTSVAMGNSHETVKKHAKYVTDDVSQDGLFKAFKMLELID